jgi:geranylgeranyl diphosphate synthase type II
MIDVYIERMVPLIEAALEEHFPPMPKYATRVYESMRYTLFSKAKRIRPLLMLIIAETFKCDLKKVLPFACAIEYVHTSSLILDDLPCMDDATLRRDKPANHIVFGENIAILAAIGLLNHAYSLIAKFNDDVDNNKLLEILDIMTAAISIDGLVGGQSLDLIHKEKKVELDVLEYMHRCKTASLFVASADISAILCNAKEKERKALTNYAKYIGLAFQISDDLSDQLLTEKELGKDVKKDTLSTTYVSFYGVEGTIKFINELIENAKKELTGLNYDCSLLIQLADKLKNKKYLS